MFDIGWTEFLWVAIVAIIVIGPKDLPKAMHTVGKWVRKARGMATEFQNGLEDVVRDAELEEMRDVAKLARSGSLGKIITETIDPTGGVNQLKEEAELAAHEIKNTFTDEQKATDEHKATDEQKASIDKQKAPTDEHKGSSLSGLKESDKLSDEHEPQTATQQTVTSAQVSSAPPVDTAQQKTHLAPKPATQHSNAVKSNSSSTSQKPTSQSGVKTSRVKPSLTDTQKAAQTATPSKPTTTPQKREKIESKKKTSRKTVTRASEPKKRLASSPKRTAKATHTKATGHTL